MGLTRPLPGEHAEGLAAYIAKVPQGDILGLLASQAVEIAALFGGLTEAQGAYRYAPGKWSLKDLLQHLSDGERIFAYRCLRIGRGDTTPLPGWEEDDYAPQAHADARSLPDLLAEFQSVRQASLALFRGLPEGAWESMGTSNGKPLSARTVPYLCFGHPAHHLAVIRERYLPGLK
jgi:hypothetical protein